MTLVLLRHGESEWNLENRFTGWTDVDLSEAGRAEATQAGVLLKAAGLDFDVCFTSTLIRAKHTLALALEQLGRTDLEPIESWKLNERHYGMLQGLNKGETAAKYGEEQVKLWRRAYEVAPPLLAADDPRNPARQPQYKNVSPILLPLGESLRDTVVRVIPYYHSDIRPLLTQGKRVLIAAHGNSLRALIMHLEQLTPDEILNVELPTAVPLVYTLTQDFTVVSKTYLGDPAILAAKLQKVANQGKAQ